jgi:F0F1-type ATP synthase assembly protein I
MVEFMILRRFLEAVLSALGWLVDMLFPQAVILTVLLVLGFAALLLLIVRRARLRSLATMALPPVEIVAAAGKSNRPPT